MKIIISLPHIKKLLLLSTYTLLGFCYFWVKTCEISSQLYEIITNYLLILVRVTPKQCLGAILLRDSKIQSTSSLSVKWKPNNFRVASCNSGNLQVVSYNSTIPWVASCEFIIRLWVRSSISRHYIKSALWK